MHPDLNTRRGRSGRPWRRLRAQVLAEETRCWLCGHPVDRTLPGAHPQGPTVDHIIPLSRGGNPLDRNNARLAHRRCNVTRGARPPTRPRRQW